MTIRHQFATLDLYRDVTRFVKDCNGVWTTVQRFRYLLPQFEVATDRALGNDGAQQQELHVRRRHQCAKRTGPTAATPARFCKTKVL